MRARAISSAVERSGHGSPGSFAVRISDRRRMRISAVRRQAPAPRRRRRGSGVSIDGFRCSRKARMPSAKILRDRAQSVELRSSIRILGLGRRRRADRRSRERGLDLALRGRSTVLGAHLRDEAHRERRCAAMKRRSSSNTGGATSAASRAPAPPSRDRHRRWAARCWTRGSTNPSAGSASAP